MGRIEELERKLEELEQKKEEPKKKLFTLPWKVKSLLKKTDKKADHIFIEYLTMKGTIEFRSERVVSGNIVVIRNKAYVVNPKNSYRYGKSLWYIIQEHNRYPISNDNYDEVKERGHDTDADVPLIKAVLAASQKPSAITSKNLWIIITVIAAAGIALFFFMPK